MANCWVCGKTREVKFNYTSCEEEQRVSQVLVTTRVEIKNTVCNDCLREITATAQQEVRRIILGMRAGRNNK